MNESEYWQRLKDKTLKTERDFKTCCATFGYRYQSLLNMHQRGVFPTVDKILNIALFYNTTVEYLVAGITEPITDARVKELEEQLEKISSIASS